MTHADVMGMVEELGIPFAYDHFAQGEVPPAPYVCFRFEKSANFSADDVVYAVLQELHLELYCEVKDPETEAQVEDVLLKHGLFWDKSEKWVEREKLYEVLYRVTV